MITKLNDKANKYIVSRYQFLTILNAAIECEEYHFAKQSAMLWLVNYPGDLFVQYAQGKIHEKMNMGHEAISIFNNLIDQDPFFIEPYKEIVNLSSSKDKQSIYIPLLNFLTHKTPSENSVGWIKLLWQIRDAYNSKNYDDSLSLIHQLLVQDIPTPIPAIFHLQTVYKTKNMEMLYNLSEIYYEKFPKCLQINILRALAEMAVDEETSAVERMHWTAAHDSSGQVVQRMMGTRHRFSQLWPDSTEIFFDVPIPAAVSGYLGWNQLQSGQVAEPEFKQKFTRPNPQMDITQPVMINNQPDLEQNPVKLMHAKKQADISQKSLPENQSDDFATKQDFEEIQKSFSKIAKRLKKPELERADNRFPIYVVMTSKKQLESVYGTNTAGVITDDLQKLANLVQKLPDWGAMLFCPDDPAQMAQLGINPKMGNDAWQLKLGLADLDKSLSKRGEMIGALLIVGGPNIVPFHHLPNPTLDSDLDVPSDNPYGTIDENYFIPQWPVGRLPGESGTDAGLLLYQIRHLIYQYQKKTDSAKTGPFDIISAFNWIWRFVINFGGLFDKVNDLGYSAEIWKEASEKVFNAIGNANNLNLSPPTDSSNIILTNKHNLELGYFNLHGIKDGPNWYGQKDYSSTAEGPDYPIALSPSMFNGKLKPPEFILSEACYGANILEKFHNDAMSLKFLDSGTNSFIGSTCIAYGSLTANLIAADSLAEKYWKKVLEGQPSGYALMQAKLSLAEDMSLEQGFLDGEDQKTILSFVLYGDPLATYDGIRALPKPLYRMKSHPSVRTISDYDLEVTTDEDEMPRNVNRQVKKVVEKYLPGLSDAEIVLNKSEAVKKPKSNKTLIPERYVVTMQKSIQKNHSMTHQHYARMTFDQKGKLVKFTTSR